MNYLVAGSASFASVPPANALIVDAAPSAPIRVSYCKSRLNERIRATIMACENKLMKRISERLPVSQTKSNVARYIDLQLQAIQPEKTLALVADEAGLPQRNLLSMIRTGVTKLPFERIPGLAKALSVNPNHLFRIALEEYQPHIKALLDESTQRVVSQHEGQLLDAWRGANGDMDPPIEPIRNEIFALASRAQALANGAENLEARRAPASDAIK